MLRQLEKNLRENFLKGTKRITQRGAKIENGQIHPSKTPVDKENDADSENDDLFMLARKFCLKNLKKS